mmetsp:Transcript_18396/g.27546  ORF Transcript_18396/g.27546 Transcript_18396/m.27546 type:complete len:552 (-) Transcript_18396:7-1662(-)
MDKSKILACQKDLKIRMCSSSTSFEGKQFMQGLTLFENVIDKKQHDELVAFVDNMCLLGRKGKLPGRTYTCPPSKWIGCKQSREMLQFGVYTNANRVQKAPVMEMPPLLQSVCDILVEKNILTSKQKVDTCCVNVYAPGQWLPPHVDNEKFARPFVTVSLVSRQIAVFGDNILKDQIGNWVGDVKVHMPVASALRVTDLAAGPTTKHAIQTVGMRRISLTFRRLTSEAKAKMWDSMSERVLQKWSRVQVAGRELCAGGSTGIERNINKMNESKDKRSISTKSAPVSKEIEEEIRDMDLTSRYESRKIPNLEKKHVKDIYDAIADHWNATRQRSWPRVKTWLEKNDASERLIMDVGCGNGKNMRPCGNSGRVFGCDISNAQLHICREISTLAWGLAQADAGDKLPFRSASFDLALNIAVLHHISSRSRREQVVKETMRMLRIGGKALFYVWAFEQNSHQGARSGHQFEKQDVLVPWHFRDIKSVSASNITSKDAGETKENKTSIYMRYCHVHKKGELEELFQALGKKVRIVDSYYDAGNWCVEAERLEYWDS